MEAKREEQMRAIEKAMGAWKDEDYPELRDGAGAVPPDDQALSATANARRPRCFTACRQRTGAELLGTLEHHEITRGVAQARLSQARRRAA